MINHHNFFKVHLPKKNYKGKVDNELTEIFMEEAYLMSDGNWTKDYNPISPKADKFEISLYPSIVYAANKLNYSENEKFQMFNDFIDSSFVDFLERFNPAYKCTSFIEYHLFYFKGEKSEFYKHVKYQIISVVKKRKEVKKKVYDYDNLEMILNDWCDSKMNKKKEYSTEIKKANNVFVNNNSKIKSQSIGIENDQEETIWNKVNIVVAIVVGIITIIGVLWQIMN